MELKENILHYIWQLKLLPHQLLQTSDGEKITILKPGYLNDDAGPDFSQARIKIGDTEWAGNVEMHINSSDWYAHKHDEDDAYRSVILHVVWNHNRDVLNQRHPIPTLELKHLIDTREIMRYADFIQQSDTLPCRPWLQDVQRFTWSQWMEKLAVKRLEKRYREIETIFDRSGKDAEHALLIILAGVYGLRVNKIPFTELLSDLPWHAIRKCRSSLLSLEALLFGRAGMLTGNAADGYQQSLKNEYEYLRKKFLLQPPAPLNWKFSRMRPAAFPSLRIAQFCSMYHQHESILQMLIEVDTPEECSKIFNGLPGPYWTDHYRFGKTSVAKEKRPGKQFSDLLIINAIAPFLFFYGKHTGNEALISKSLKWLEQTVPEDNSIIRNWKSEGIKAMSAFQTQALIELKTTYCDPRNCLQCAIGHEILQKHNI